MSETLTQYLRNFARHGTVLAVLVCCVGCNLLPTVRAQTAAEPLLTKREKRDAQRLSVMFTRRLGETRDLRIVMDELFVPDVANHYIAEEKQKASRFGASEITLWSGIFVDNSLLEEAPPEVWLRLYITATNLMLFGLIYASRHHTSEELEAKDLYPKAVIELLDTNPLTRNLIESKTDLRTLKSAAEMRSVAATLEQAINIMRKSLPTRIDVEKTILQMVMRSSAGGHRLTPKELRIARANLMKPRLEISDSEDFGFPRGSRMIWISSFAMLDLLMVRVGGKLRIVWAQPIAD